MYSYSTFMIGNLGGVTIERAWIRIKNIREQYNASEFGPFLIGKGDTIIVSVSTEGGLTEINISNDTS